jgi:TetR/AcrR family tetracycline transcriptional repressor
MDSSHSARPAPRRGAPPRGERLTRDAVITRAGELIERDGLAAFSLRALAEALGVRPNALYNHIRNRDDLLDAVTEQFVTSIHLPGGDQPWPDWVRSVAARLRAQLLGQPGLTELLLSRAGATAAGPAVLRRFHARLECAGVEPAVAHVAWHAVLTVVVGSVQQERARDTDQAPTFAAVLEVTLAGLTAAAGRAPSAEAEALLDAHAPGSRPQQGGFLDVQR